MRKIEMSVSQLIIVGFEKLKRQNVHQLMDPPRIISNIQVLQRRGIEQVQIRGDSRGFGTCSVPRL